MAVIAVIDTETNWHDQVMSLGAVIAGEDWQVLEKHYFILTPEYRVGGMFSGTLQAPGAVVCTRARALAALRKCLQQWRVSGLYAYNAAFDRRHLPELGDYGWYDIMRIAAYRQTNPRIPECADCCSTGRLRRDYGVQAMLRLLSGDGGYCESHNALADALDELHIMRLLGRRAADYIPL